MDCEKLINCVTGVLLSTVLALVFALLLELIFGFGWWFCREMFIW